MFASPATVDVLRAAGLDEADIAASRPTDPGDAGRDRGRDVVPSDVRRRRPTRRPRPSGSTGRRSTLCSLDLAAASGVVVRLGETVTSVEDGRVMLAGGVSIRAAVIVGADGLRSVVARSFGVARPARLAPRVGLTFHVTDPRPEGRDDARIVLFDGGYVGLAPVPGRRVNVGIVLGGRVAGAAPAGRRRGDGRRRARSDPAGAPTIRSTGRPPRAATRSKGRRRSASGPSGGPVGAGCSSAMRPGSSIPFTGEGLHRALASASLAAAAVDRHLDGDAAALTAYDRAMTARFRSKDVAQPRRPGVSRPSRRSSTTPLAGSPLVAGSVRRWAS